MNKLAITALSFSEAKRTATKSRLFVSLPDEVRALPRATQIAAVRTSLASMLTPSTRLRFSQHAGCSCPCSPGFIVEGPAFTAMPAKHKPFADFKTAAKVTHWGVCDMHVTLN